MLNHICANVYSATWCFAWQTFACCVSEFVTLTAVQTNMLSYVIDQKCIYDLHIYIKTDDSTVLWPCLSLSLSLSLSHTHTHTHDAQNSGFEQSIANI